MTILCKMKQDFKYPKDSGSKLLLAEKAMADEVTICSMMADLIRWCCWRFDPGAQRTVLVRNQRSSSVPMTDESFQQLREEVYQQQERINTLRLATQTFTTSLRNLHERIDAIEAQLNIPQSRLSL